jgi:hypothetical protein
LGYPNSTYGNTVRNQSHYVGSLEVKKFFLWQLFISEFRREMHENSIYSAVQFIILSTYRTPIAPCPVNIHPSLQRSIHISLSFSSLPRASAGCAHCAFYSDVLFHNAGPAAYSP